MGQAFEARCLLEFGRCRPPIIMNYEPSEIYVKSKGEPKKVTFAAEVKVLGLPETQKQDNTILQRLQKVLKRKSPSTMTLMLQVNQSVRKWKTSSQLTSRRRRLPYHNFRGISLLVKLSRKLTL
jgi:hypothetical protein